MLNRMNIDDNTGRYEKRDSIGLQETSKKVGIFDSRDKNPDHEIVKNKEPQSCMETVSPDLGLSHVQEKLQSNSGIMNWVASGVATPLHEEPQKHCGMTPGENQSTMNAQAVPFELAASYTAPSIGLDMWRQLKRVEIPSFSGEKKNDQSWGRQLSFHVLTAPPPRESTSFCSFASIYPGMLLR